MMQLITIHNGEYNPQYIYEDYHSLIWTERYLEPGEFELKSYSIDKTRRFLPKFTLVSLMETREIMVVESHSISISDSGVREITVKGKSLDSIFAWRDITATQYGKTFKMARTYTIDEAAAVLMWNTVANNTTRDVLRAGIFGLPILNYIGSAAVTNSTRKSTPRVRRWLESGTVQAPLFALLDRPNARFGVRTVRPIHIPYAFGSPLVSVTSVNGNKGIYSEDNTLWLTGMVAFDIYEGYDRTVNQSANTKVIFHYQSQDLTAPTYLMSHENYAKTIGVKSSVGNVDVSNPQITYNTGIYFRVVQHDAGSPGSDESNAEFLADLPEIGEGVLKDHKDVSMIDAEISPTSGYRYTPNKVYLSELNGAYEMYKQWGYDIPIEYYLGDLVTVVGDYGIQQTMRVKEYTMTKDAEGVRGFPGLAVED